MRTRVCMIRNTTTFTFFKPEYDENGQVGKTRVMRSTSYYSNSGNLFINGIGEIRYYHRPAYQEVKGRTYFFNKDGDFYRDNNE